MSEPEAGESTGMRGQMTHLDTDVLAEFRAGLITGRRGARIAAHLAGCGRCTALDEQLAGVSSLLASVPAPAMPDSVARRLDMVLAAEVAQRDTAQREAVLQDRAERADGDGARESPAPRRPGGNRGFRLLALRVLAPAAAVVVLAAGGYGLSRINLGSSTGSSASAGSAAQGAVPSAAASAKSGGSVSAPEAGPKRGAVSRPQGISAAGITVVTGHANLSRADLGQQVRAALNVPPSARTTRAATSPERGCVLGLIGRQQLELVESVSFEGSPATLVVARTGARDTAWVAAPGCSATHRHVLDTTSLPSGISGP
jgi:nucleotide-binding universal stress UspA family protein